MKEEINMRDSSKILLDKYQVRKSKEQKKSFINWLEDYLEKYDYTLQQDTYKTGINLIVGNVEESELILTAHYDTQPNFFIPIFMGISNYFSFFISQLWMLFIMFAIPVIVTLVVTKLTASFLISYFTFVFAFALVALLQMFGIANKHTANDNTSGVATLLAILEDLPNDKRNKVSFVFFDQEEVGLVGSAAFKKKYKTILETKPLINFDCVSDGNTLIFIEKKAFRQSKVGIKLNNVIDTLSLEINKNSLSRDTLTTIYKKEGIRKIEQNELGSNEHISINKHVLVKNALTAIYTSDQIQFKNSVGVGAFNKLPLFGYYLSRIHTSRDTKFDATNVELIKSIIMKLI